MRAWGSGRTPRGPQRGRRRLAARRRGRCVCSSGAFSGLRRWVIAAEGARPKWRVGREQVDQVSRHCERSEAIKCGSEAGRLLRPPSFARVLAMTVLLGATVRLDGRAGFVIRSEVLGPAFAARP